MSQVPESPGNAKDLNWDGQYYSSEWIDVKKYLPEDDQAVLMCDCHLKGLPIIGWYECIGCPSGFYTENSNYRTIVTHWMPLPKVPR